MDNLNLQPHVVDTHVVVCSLHFRTEDIYRKYIRPRWKYFLVPDAIPLVNYFQKGLKRIFFRLKKIIHLLLQKWVDDPRNVPRKYEKVDPEYQTPDEIEINIEPEQISYENDAAILLKPKIEPVTTRTFTFIEVPHANEEVSLENTHAILKNEPMKMEISNTDEKQFNVVGNEVAPGTTQVLWELRKVRNFRFCFLTHIYNF